MCGVAALLCMERCITVCPAPSHQRSATHLSSAMSWQQERPRKRRPRARAMWRGRPSKSAARTCGGGGAFSHQRDTLINQTINQDTASTSKPRKDVSMRVPLTSR